MKIADQQELQARLSVENPPEGLWQMIKRKVAKFFGF